MENFDVVPTHLVVKALQDSGYRNAAFAVAELIDNAIQANATTVDLLCSERTEMVARRRRAGMTAIAVLDNGEGMDSHTLRTALQFGNGSRLEDRSGIGRFGMGLPNSSFSQGERVEVFTWRDGPGSAIYSYLDLDEIQAGTMREVPEPSSREIPEMWVRHGRKLGSSGTLVIWPKLSRCTWKTSSALFRNAEELIGRIYRYCIDEGGVTIRLAGFDEAQSGKYVKDDIAVPTDPLYLMKGTSCPEPWRDRAMFEQWPDDGSVKEFTVDGHDVFVRITVAKKEARAGVAPGKLPHGKHAARHAGVSIVRAKRELELDPSWLPSKTTARWIGVEINFPPALDEVFGVTNNKQSAAHLAALGSVDLDEYCIQLGFDTIHKLEEEWESDGDPRLPLLKIKQYVAKQISALNRHLEAHSKGQRSKRHNTSDPNSPEAKGTQVTNNRKEEGFKGRSDEGEKLSADERTRILEEEFTSAGHELKEAQELAAKAVTSQVKYRFEHRSLPSSAFFAVDGKAGILNITLNTDHPAYRNFIGLVEEDPSEENTQELRASRERALSGLKLLLEAWARYEDELPDRQRDRAREVREDWGKIARQFLDDDE